MTQGARTARVAEEFREILAEAIQKLKDPRIGFVTVTGVQVTADLRRAWVSYTVLGDDKQQRSTRRPALGDAAPPPGARQAGSAAEPPGARVPGGPDARAASAHRGDHRAPASRGDRCLRTTSRRRSDGRRRSRGRSRGRDRLPREPGRRRARLDARARGPSACPGATTICSFGNDRSSFHGGPRSSPAPTGSWSRGRAGGARRDGDVRLRVVRSTRRPRGPLRAPVS